MLLPEAAGPHDPLSGTPPRRPGSVRRTSSIDSARPFGLRADVLVEARARDLRTGADGSVEVLGTASLRARIEGPSRRLLSLETTPDVPALAALVGLRTSSGFRARLDQVAPSERDANSLLYLLLDDLPGASLVSGYAMQRGEEGLQKDGGTSAAPLISAGMVRSDICAGWASDATIMVTIRDKGVIPTPAGPPAPTLEPPDDPMAWHEMDPLPPHGMRRRRRLDIVAPNGDGGNAGDPGDLGGPGSGGARFELDVHFRDSYVDHAGAESVLHEYTVLGEIDASERRVAQLAARARVLPWTECPGAVASAGRLAGMPLAGLRPWVRQELVGVSTCTHLNDTLRSLADVDALLEHLAGAST